MTFNSKRLSKTTRGGAVVTTKPMNTSGSTGNSRGGELVVVEGKYIPTGSKKAELVFFEEAGQQWLPASQIKKRTVTDTTEHNEDIVQYHIPRWLADAKDLNAMELGDVGEDGEEQKAGGRSRI